MKTDELIKALSADGEASRAPYNTAILIALLIGAGLTTIVFAAALGVRSDFAQAITTIRFPFKVLVVALAAVAAIGLAVRIGRPGAKLFPWNAAMAGAIGVLGIGAIAELYVLPPSAWLSNLNGTNRFLCLTVIPALSLTPLIASLIGLRHGAPTRPAVAGAIGGLVAGSMAAILYALNCNNDSPLFVMTWYPIAIGMVVIVGAVAGARLLRW